MTNDIAQVVETAQEILENTAAVRGIEFANLVVAYSNALAIAQVLGILVSCDSRDERLFLSQQLMTMVNGQLMVPFHDIPQAQLQEAFGLGKRLHSMAQIKA